MDGSGSKIWRRKYGSGDSEWGFRRKEGSEIQLYKYDSRDEDRL